MSRRWVGPAVLAVAIGVAIALGFGPRSDGAGAPVSTPIGLDAVEISGSEDGRHDNLAGHASPAPLQLPFKPASPGLWQQARRGDARAQCRIAAEYQRCKDAQDRLAIAELVARQLEHARAGDSMKVAAMALGKTGAGEDLAQCDDFAAMAPSQAVQLWRGAALSGNGEAMVRYATGAAFPTDRIVELADELKLYKREALPMARKAAAAGDGRAVIALALAYSPDSRHVGAPPLLAQVTGVDMRQSLALFMYADRAGIRSGANVDRGVEAFIRAQIDLLSRAASPTQIMLAEQDAAELATAWRRPRLSGALPVHGAQGSPVGPEACEQQAP